MLGQANLPFRPTVTALSLSEIRSGGWIGLTAVMTVGSGLIQLAAIPFWSPTVTIAATFGVNVALLVITLSIPMSYDVSRWLGAGPLAHGAQLTVYLAVRGMAACLAVALASLLQSGIATIFGSADDRPFLRLLLGGLWVVIVFLPWTALSRIVIGRTAGPWAALALALVATWVPASASGPWRAVGWILPVLPLDPEAAFLFEPSNWGYAVLHALWVASGCALLVGRTRVPT